MAELEERRDKRLVDSYPQRSYLSCCCFRDEVFHAETCRNGRVGDDGVRWRRCRVRAVSHRNVDAVDPGGDRPERKFGPDHADADATNLPAWRLSGAARVSLCGSAPEGCREEEAQGFVQRTCQSISVRFRFAPSDLRCDRCDADRGIGVARDGPGPAEWALGRAPDQQSNSHGNWAV